MLISNHFPSKGLVHHEIEISINIYGCLGSEVRWILTEVQDRHVFVLSGDFRFFWKGISFSK